MNSRLLVTLLIMVVVAVVLMTVVSASDGGFDLGAGTAFCFFLLCVCVFVCSTEELAHLQMDSEMFQTEQPNRVKRDVFD